MPNYLVKVVETWRVPNEESASALEDSFRKDMTYELVKWAKADKEIKVKGEVVETYVLVTATKAFNDVKEPDSDVRPEYR